MKPLLNMDTLEPNLRITESETARILSRIKDAFKRGESLVKVAEDNGVSQSTIINILSRHGTSITELRAKHPQKLARERLNAIKEEQGQ